MSQSGRRFFSGPSLERALLAAASHYDVEPSRIKYEPVEKAGVSKRRGVVVRVDPEDHLLEEGAQAAAPEPASAPEVVEESPAPAKEPAKPKAKAKPRAKAKAKAEEKVEAAAEEEAEKEQAPVAKSKVARKSTKKVASTKAVEPEAEEPAEEPDAKLDAEGADKEVATAGDDSSEKSDNADAAPTAPSSAPTGKLKSLPSPLSLSEGRSQAEGAEADAARESLGKLFAVAGLELDAVVGLGDEDRLEIEVSGPDADLVVDEDGEVLLALQHLLPRVMQSALGRVVPCRLDCQGFHAVREEKLRDLALQAAGEVFGEGRPKTLQPMHPADRRIVHLALAEDPGVVTESVGSGYFKRVKVRSA